MVSVRLRRAAENDLVHIGLESRANWGQAQMERTLHGLDEALDRHFGARPPRALVLCQLDIDHFKRINDRYGHAVGDAVLKELASVCARCVRSTDVLARYGGEEFVIMLRQTTLADALTAAERIRQAIAQCGVVSGDETVRFTVSIGVASLRRSVQDAIHRADQALYAAKQQGRNRVALACEEGEGTRHAALS